MVRFDGGFDLEIGWQTYLNSLRENLKRMFELAKDESVPASRLLPPVMSGEQHIPIIDAIANDKEMKPQLNIPNKGAISGDTERYCCRGSSNCKQTWGSSGSHWQFT